MNIRFEYSRLDHKQIISLLEISINVLEDDVELSNKEKFLNYGSYFAGNIGRKGSEYLEQLHKKYSEQSFTIDDMLELTKYVRDNLETIRYDIDFLLRNDVKLVTYSNFKKSGRSFALIIDNTFGI